MRKGDLALVEKELARRALGHPLADHLKSVAVMARRLAARNGVDPRRAAVAGYLHDWVKHLSPAALRSAIRRYRVGLDSAAREAPAIWHGPVAAAVARAELNVNDPEVLAAVRWHTTGRRGSSVLERAVLVADFSSNGREFPEAGIALRLAGRSLDLAARYVLASKIAHLESSGVSPHPAAIAMWGEMTGRGIRA